MNCCFLRFCNSCWSLPCQGAGGFSGFCRPRAARSWHPRAFRRRRRRSLRESCATPARCIFKAGGARALPCLDACTRERHMCLPWLRALEPGLWIAPRDGLSDGRRSSRRGAQGAVFRTRVRAGEGNGGGGCTRREARRAAMFRGRFKGRFGNIGLAGDPRSVSAGPTAGGPGGSIRQARGGALGGEGKGAARWGREITAPRVTVTSATGTGRA